MISYNPFCREFTLAGRFVTSTNHIQQPAASKVRPSGMRGAISWWLACRFQSMISRCPISIHDFSLPDSFPPHSHFRLPPGNWIACQPPSCCFAVKPWQIQFSDSAEIQQGISNVQPQTLPTPADDGKPLLFNLLCHLDLPCRCPLACSDPLHDFYFMPLPMTMFRRCRHPQREVDQYDFDRCSFHFGFEQSYFYLAYDAALSAVITNQRSHRRLFFLLSCSTSPRSGRVIGCKRRRMYVCIHVAQLHIIPRDLD